MTPAISIDALSEAVTRLPEDRLTATRRAALMRLTEHGLPTQHHEDWKYTDLAAVIDLSNRWLADGAPTGDGAGATSVAAGITSGIDAVWLVVENGRIGAASIAAAQNAGIDVASLVDSGTTPEIDRPLADLNVALLRDGLRVRIDRDAAPGKPVGFLIVDTVATKECVAQVRIDIDVAAGGQCSFIEYHASTGASGQFTNSAIDLRIGNSAAVDFVRIQNRDRKHSQTGRLDVSVGRDGSFNHAAFDLGGKLVRNDVAIRLRDTGATAAFHGLYIAGDDQHLDNHTRVDHETGPAASDQEYRGVLGGRARCIWNGKAIVHQGADGTDANQANHNLLLSEKAEIDAKPELEIYADEVKCAHGTTIGQLDESALFYLRTRGLCRRDARQLLTRAFAQRIVSKIPIEPLQEVVGAMVDARLDALVSGDVE